MQNSEAECPIPLCTTFVQLSKPGKIIGAAKHQRWATCLRCMARMMPLLGCHSAVLPGDAAERCCIPCPAAKIIDAYPWLEASGVIDVLLPKKEQIHVGKW